MVGSLRERFGKGNFCFVLFRPEADASRSPQGCLKPLLGDWSCPGFVDRLVKNE